MYAALNHCAWSNVSNFCSGVPWEDLYADDLIFIAESLEEYVRKILTSKEAMEEKVLRVNAGKWVSMRHLLHWSGQQQHLLQQLQAQEMQWDSSTWQRTLITDLHGARELHAPWTADHRGVQVRPDKLEVVASFCYLGDMLSAASGFELSTTTHVKTALVCHNVVSANEIPMHIQSSGFK